MLLNNKIALVTGSTHNVELAIAHPCAREGAKVIDHSRDENDAEAAVVLASDEASDITHSILPVDAGRLNAPGSGGSL